jgi:putative hydrolase of the HAD superfamily
MIKAVFFDLYHTLIRHDPPYDESLSRIIGDFGIKITADDLRRPVAIADEFISNEISRLSLNQRSHEDKISLFSKYHAILLKEAGIESSNKLIHHNIIAMQQIDFKRVLFDDVLPVFRKLKQKDFILGLISNVDSDINPLLDKLGLSPLLQVVVTSLDGGFHKPQAQIFRQATCQAKVKPEEAMYIGDQYQVDILGAVNAGMQGILLDRNNYSSEDIKEPTIKDLYQLIEHLS